MRFVLSRSDNEAPLVLTLNGRVIEPTDIVDHAECFAVGTGSGAAQLSATILEIYYRQQFPYLDDPTLRQAVRATYQTFKWFVVATLPTNAVLSADAIAQFMLDHWERLYYDLDWLPLEVIIQNYESNQVPDNQFQLF